ncbi:MAG: RNA-binding protein, partial [Caldilineae bacterium]
MPEFTGRTVAEAIEAGLQELGLSQEEAVIEILDEGRG